MEIKNSKPLDSPYTRFDHSSVLVLVIHSSALNVSNFLTAVFAFDLDGDAGIVARTLGAIFGKDAVNRKDFVGIGLNLLDSGTSHSDLIELALNARPEDGFTNAAEIELLYQNLLGTHLWQTISTAGQVLLLPANLLKFLCRKWLQTRLLTQQTSILLA